MATDVATRTYPHRGSVGVQDLVERTGLARERANKVMVLLGNHARVQFDEHVTDGRLVLRFHGDETTYHKSIEHINAITDLRLKRQSLHLAGGPFTRNSILSVIVRPTVPPPLIMKDGRLHAARDSSTPLAEFARAFNNSQLRTAHATIRSLPRQSFEDRHARILAKLWLAGHPKHWGERKLLLELAEEIEHAVNSAEQNAAHRTELVSLQRWLTNLQRGIINFDQRTKDGQKVVPSMNRAEGYFARALPREPFYWKSRLYQARIWFSMDPNRNAQLWRRSEQILRDLEAVYPNNCWVRYYLHKDPSG